MSEDEIIKWFEEKLQNCYQIKKGDYTYFVYNKNYVRKKKIALIDNIKLKQPSIIDGKVLFRENNINNFFYCDEKIWDFLQNNYSNNYNELYELIMMILKKNKLNSRLI